MPAGPPGPAALPSVPFGPVAVLGLVAAAWLEPDSSALLLLGKVNDKDQALRELGRYEGRVVSTDLPAEARDELQAALAGQLRT